VSDHDRAPASGSGGRPRDGKALIGGRPLRFWVILALVVVGAILVLQNSETIEVKVLWFEIQMPLVFLLLAMVAVGAALDRAWQWRQNKR
jgi:uncharacterized integral membrane protein